MKDADLIVYVLDGDETDDYPVSDNAIHVRSKKDITGNQDYLSFSSITGDGIDEVIKAIKEKLVSSDAALSADPLANTADSAKSVQNASNTTFFMETS